MRTLDAIYPIVYLDALVVKMRSEGRLENRAVYVAVGITLSGQKEVLGLWTSANEGSVEQRRASWRSAESLAPEEQWMEKICQRENLWQAFKRVKGNGGSPGIDGMTVNDGR
jgi:Transposase, Mutator family